LTSRMMNRTEYEDRETDSSVPMLILSAVALFGLALLMVYICFAAPNPGTSMGAIRDVLRGLGGELAVVLPLVLAWAGALCVGSAKGMKLSPVRIAADVLLVVCLYTSVHVFFVENISSRYAVVLGYADFVAKSYRCATGGGAIGALLAWPLYRNFGVAGGFIGSLLIAVMLLTATGRMGRLARFVSARTAAARKTRDTKKEKLESFEFEKPKKASRRTVNRDPFSEELMGGRSERPAPQRRPAGRSAQSARERSAANGNAASRPAHAVNQPTRRRPAPQGAGNPDLQERRPVAARPAKSQAAAQAAPRKRKKLYIENVDNAPVQAAQEDALFDEFDRLEAESAAFDKAEKEEKAPRRSFTPDRPSMLRKDRQEIVDIPGEIPQTTPEKAADAVQESASSSDKDMEKASSDSVSLEDLKIQPEAYEAADEDEAAPFDVPTEASEPIQEVEAGIAEPKLGKLKRVKQPEPVEEEPLVYNYPPIDLLAQGEVEDTSAHGQRDMQKAKLLEDTLRSFGISAKLTGIAHGPAVTRFELQPAPGVKVSRITSLSDDIALNLAAMSVRIEAPIPGKAAVGVEIPNDKVEMVRLRDVLESQEARKHPSRIAVGLGKDNSGRYIVADIAKMPHVLIAGQTGSGKSVCINAIIASILFRSSPEEVKLILIDPKVVELSIYNDIPHLVCPVVTDPKKAASALDWAVAEMTKRYKLFAERGVRDIKGYNKALKPGEKLMPQMVIIIDELADLMMVSPGEVEDSICRLAQLARACGMHLVIATQRPSVNVITGIIKANIPTRIAFSVASQVDSRTMIDHGGAEKLLGNGDMLFVPNGMKSMRVQGAWVSDDEVHSIVEYIKQSGEATYDPDMLEHMENAVRTDAEKEEIESEYDPKLPEAVDIALELQQVSISMLQRKMRIGYARAGRIIDEMARRGIVSDADGSKPRQILISREQAQQLFEDCA